MESKNVEKTEDPNFNAYYGPLETPEKPIAQSEQSEETTDLYRKAYEAYKNECDALKQSKAPIIAKFVESTIRDMQNLITESMKQGQVCIPLPNIELTNDELQTVVLELRRIFAPFSVGGHITSKMISLNWTQDIKQTHGRCPKCTAINPIVTLWNRVLLNADAVNADSITLINQLFQCKLILNLHLVETFKIFTMTTESLKTSQKTCVVLNVNLIFIKRSFGSRN